MKFFLVQFFHLDILGKEFSGKKLVKIIFSCKKLFLRGGPHGRSWGGAMVTRVGPKKFMGPLLNWSDPCLILNKFFYFIRHMKWPPRGRYRTVAYITNEAT